MSADRSPVLLAPDEGRALAWKGDLAVWKALGAETAGSYCLLWTRLAPGAVTPPHVRTREDEGLYVLSGEVTVTAGRRTLRAGAGGFVNVGRGTAYRFGNAGTEPAELLVVNAPAGFDRLHLEVGKVLTDPLATVPPWTEDDDRRLTEAAPRYGVVLDPPPAAFAAEPDLTVRGPGEGVAHAVLGDVYVLKAGGDRTHGAYALWDFLVPGGHGTPPHVHHREDEAFFVLEGVLAFYMGHERRRVTVAAGGFLNGPRDVPHFFRNEGAAPARALVVAAPAGLECFIAAVGRALPDAATPAPTPTPKDVERLTRLAPQFGIEIFAADGPASVPQ